MLSLIASACVGGGGGGSAGGTGGAGIDLGQGVTPTDSSGTEDTAATGSDAGATGADGGATGSDGSTAGDGQATGDGAVADADGGTTGMDGKGDGVAVDVIMVDGSSGEGVKTDGMSSDVLPPKDGSTDSSGDGGSSDVKTDVIGSQDCCKTSSAPGCMDPAIVECVCAKDSFCCSNSWDNVCVSNVNAFNCGKCAAVDGGGTDGGSPDGGSDGGSDIDFSEVSSTQDCCVAGKAPGCVKKDVQKCVCAQDDYCCTTAWDNICVGEVTKFGCGVCAGVDGGSTDGGSTDVKPDGGAVDGGSADSGSTAAKGCTSPADKTYLSLLAEDAAKAAKFSDDVKSCLLANISKPDEASAAAAIGKCLVEEKKQGVTAACGGCYGILGHCTFVNCVTNPAESEKANCLSAPSGAPCVTCMTKFDCIKKSDNCKAGL